MYMYIDELENLSFNRMNFNIAMENLRIKSFQSDQQSKFFSSLLFSMEEINMTANLVLNSWKLGDVHQIFRVGSTIISPYKRISEYE